MVAQVQRRPLRELAAHVEHRALLHVHGRAPLGQVLHGGLARAGARRRGSPACSRSSISIATAFTGYLSQQNFDSEWIGTQAKDGINSTGAGAFWNVLNFGQMLMWHIVLLPLVVAILIGIHVLLVRRRGVVPPFAPTEGQLAKAGRGRTLDGGRRSRAGSGTASPAAAGGHRAAGGAAQPLAGTQPAARPTSPCRRPQPMPEDQSSTRDRPAPAHRPTAPAGGPVVTATDPAAASAPRRPPGRRFRPDRDVVEWQGAYRRYDLLKEVFVAFLVVLLLTVGCAIVFSSPDERAGDREVLVERRTGGLRPDGDDRARRHEPDRRPTGRRTPTRPASSQMLGPISIETAVGVRIPIDTAQDFVLGPLATLPDRPALDAALRRVRRRLLGTAGAPGMPPTRRSSRTRPSPTASWS